MRERSRIVNLISQEFLRGLFQRAKAALRALSFRCFADNFCARALPPFKPPSLPSATAAGFFFVLELSGMPDSSQNQAGI